MSWNVGDTRNISLRLKSNLGSSHVVLNTPKASPKKKKPTAFDMHVLQYIGKTDPTEEIFCLLWTLYIMVGKGV